MMNTENKAAQLEKLIEDNEILCARIDYLIRRVNQQGHPGDAAEITELSREVRENMIIIRRESEKQSLNGAA